MADLLMKMPDPYEPKRKNRFILTFPTSLGINSWYVESAARPKITIASKDIPFLNTKTYVAGMFEWGTIGVTFRDDLTSERVYTEEWCTGLEEVSAIGMGLMLIKAEVFRKMAKPWFHIHYQNGVYSGEDIWFCRSARETGFKVMLDHDISHHVRHIGAFEFSCAHAAASRGE